MRSCASSHAAAAERASGDCAPPSRERTAPAPRKSSSAGRSEPSGHRSPHAITMMGALCCCAHPATASALRRQAATTVEPASWANAAHVEPLGEGSTTASPRIRRKRLIGDSDGPSAVLLSASSAPTVRAKSRAESSSCLRNGYTSAPRLVPASTAVVNRRTSTMTTVPSPTASTPVVPHSNRTSKPLCPAHAGASISQSWPARRVPGRVSSIRTSLGRGWAAGGCETRVPMRITAQCFARQAVSDLFVRVHATGCQGEGCGR